ncbi:kita-kyushu lung cancer antigen 1 [Hyaena hyaena]|uniref:kita-kyushu lung cancer antigen 1 n=1 Tax=Hyaena hyaena TaxID=95912 RepID=UPI001922A5A9|nr:kita-kyushu lung cancer antigen 1 [Hyaena hyaena]
MSILLLLLSCVLFTFLFVIVKICLQSSVGEVSSNSTSLALVRTPSSTGSTKSKSNKNLSVNSSSQDFVINYPRMIAMQKRMLVNLGIVEYKLAELEHLLIIKSLNERR